MGSKITFTAVMKFRPSVLASDLQSLSAKKTAVGIRDAFSAARDFLFQGKFLLANENFQKVIKASPDFIGGYKGLGLACLGMEKFKDALAAFTAALKIDPDRADVHEEIGGCYGRMGRTDEAIDSFISALQLNAKQKQDDKNMLVWLHLGSLYMLQGRPEDAEDAFMKCMALGQECRGAATFGLGNVFSIQGDNDKAIQYFKSAKEMDPSIAKEADLNITGCLVSKALAVLESGDCDGAVAIAKEIRSMKVDLREEQKGALSHVFIYSAEMKRVNGDLAGAVPLAKDAFEIRPDIFLDRQKLAMATYNLSLDLLSECYYSEAIQRLEDLLKLDDVMPEKFKRNSRINLGYSYFAIEQYEKCIELFDGFLTTLPKGGEVFHAWFYKGMAFTEIGKFDLAIESFNHALSWLEGKPLVLGRMGNVYRLRYKTSNNESDMVEAIKYFEKALSLDPGNDYTKGMLALTRDRDVKTAISCFDLFLEKAPKGSDSATEKLLAKLKSGQYSV
jgi:tetratricopeptide (TPR) repeat protein